MTSRPPSPSLESPRRLAKRSSKTRKSIKKFYPNGQVNDNTNPLTLHSVNDDLFPRLWSFLAETMIAQGELPSTTKEAIAWRVNAGKSTLTRRLPPPSKKHTMSQEEKTEVDQKEEALQYTELLLSFSNKNGNDVTSFPLLSNAAKAETALVVLLFRHLSRSMTAVLGEQRKSMALQSVSFRLSAQRRDSGMRGVVQRMIRSSATSTPQTKPGLTSPLFASTGGGWANNSSNSFFFNDGLPEHLQDAFLVGEDCANALGRLVAWVDSYEIVLLGENILTEGVLELVEETVPPPNIRSHKIAQWVSAELSPTPNELRGEGDLSRDIARVFLMVQCSPESVANCSWWKDLGTVLGKDKATTLLLWWSLRITLEQAKGLGATAGTFSFA